MAKSPPPGKNSGVVRINYNKVQKYAHRLGDDACKKAADATKDRVVAKIRMEDRIDTGRMVDSIKVEKTYGMNYRVIGRAPYLGLQEGGRGAIKSGTRMSKANGKKGRRRRPMVFYWRKVGKRVQVLRVAEDPGGHFFQDARDKLRHSDWF